MHHSDYLIIGSSAAGIAAANTIRKLDPAGSITILTAESAEPYNKCLLVDVATNIRPHESLSIASHASLNAQAIALITDCRVLSIDEKARTLTTSKKPWQYTKLLLATGTQPIQLPVFAEVKDLYYFHTADDLNTLLELLQTPNNQHIAVIGAGLSGLEATDALRYHQTQVSIFNRGTGVLSRHVPRDGQDYLHHILKRNQVATYFEQTIQSINLKTDGTYSVLTTNSTTIHDITAFLCTLGTTACAHSFIDSTSIRHEQGFIIVDDNMRTSTDHIYAAGDAIITKNKISGQPCRSTLWPDAVQQAITAAHHMVGKEKPYAGTIPLVSSSFFATRFISCGYVQDPLVNHITSTISDAGYQAYCYNQNNELIGFVLIGDTSMLPAARAQLKKTSA